MRRTAPLLFRALLPVLAAVAPPAFATPGAPGPYTWTAGYSGGAWTDAGNWDTNPFTPSLGADVTLPATTYANLNVDSQIASLTAFPGLYLNSSVGVHLLTVDNAINLTGGASANYLQDVAIISNGSTTWNSGEIYTYYGASFTNKGTFDVKSDNTWAPGALPAPAFTNTSTGTITKKAGTGTSTIHGALRNLGTARADVGTLQLIGDSSATSSGTYISTADGSVSLSNMVLTAGSTFTGFGGVSKLFTGNRVAGATSLNFTRVQITGQNNTIDAPVSVDALSTLELTASGDLRGSGSVSGPGTFLFSGGTLFGSTSPGAFTINSQFLISGPGIRYIQDGTITTAGNGTWSAGDVYGYYGPTLNNAGTLSMTGDNTLASGTVTPLILNNTGTLRKTAGVAVSTIIASVNNTGSIIADSGTLSVTSDADAAPSTGTFTSNGAGSVTLGAFNLGTGATFSGSGASQLGTGNTVSGNAQLTAAHVKVTGAANLITGSLHLDAPSVLEVAGGGLGGTGSVNGPGTLLFTAGSLVAAPGAALTVNSPMRIDGPLIRYVQELTLNTAGTTTWAGGDIYTYYAPTLNNTGTFDIVGDNSISPGAGPNLTLNNAGTLRKSAGAGITSILASIRNTSLIVADSGTLSLTSDDAALPSTGAFFSNVGGTLQLNNFKLTTGANFGGTATTELATGNTLNGNVTVSPGATLAVTGASTFDGSLQLATGANLHIAFNGAIRGSGSIHGPGTFTWAEGSVFGSTLPASTLTSFAPVVISGPGYKFLQEGSFTNAGLATWLEGPIFTYYGPTFRNTGTLDIQGDVSFSSGASPEPTLVNTGTLKKTGGTSLTTLNGDISSPGPGAVIRLETGITRFTGPSFSSTGFFTLLPGATVLLDSAVTTIGGVHTWPHAHPLVTNGTTTFLTDSSAPAGTSELDITSIGPSLTFASTHHLTALTIAAGSATVAGPGATLHTKSLTFGVNTSLDLTDDALMLHYAGDPSPVDDVRAHLLAGRITSSVADPSDLFSIGYQDLANAAVLARFTYHGDANLNGRVDRDDLALIDRGFAFNLANAHWTDGDFNYDGSVTPADYLLIDRVFLQQGAPVSPAFLSLRESQFGANYVSQLLTSIPEPSSLLAACGLALLPMRHRRPH